MNSLLAWHGTRADGTTKHLEIKEVVGVKNVLAGDVVLCENALHGNIRAVDMLQYSQGLWVKRTLHEGTILRDSDKIGSSERTVIAEADATQVVLDWAFWCTNRAVFIHAVSALRQAGMGAEAEKLAGLKAITDKESANATSSAAVAVAQNIGTGHAAYNNVYIATNAVCAAANAAGHAASAAAGADAVRVNARATACATANVAVRAAYAVRTAYATANAHAVSCAVYDSVEQAIFTTASTTYAAANAVEMDLLNTELEHRLFALMGLNERKITK